MKIHECFPFKKALTFMTLFTIMEQQNSFLKGQ
jgi:hypothetical protein